MNLESLVQAATKSAAKGCARGLRDAGRRRTTPRTGPGSSPTGLARRTQELRVLHRRPRPAWAPRISPGSRGARRGAGYVMEMDADFSTTPRISAGCSRRPARRHARAWLTLCPGGGVQAGALRRLISRGGSLYARVILGVGQHDLTGGFKCFRSAPLEAIRPGSVTSQGLRLSNRADYRRRAAA